MQCKEGKNWFQWRNLGKEAWCLLKCRAATAQDILGLAEWYAKGVGEGEMKGRKAIESFIAIKYHEHSFCGDTGTG